MKQLTNSDTLTLEPGASVTFDTTLHSTGCDVCHRKNSGLVNLNAGCAKYWVSFTGTVTTTAAGAAQLAILLDGEILPETIMNTTIAAVGDLETVGNGTYVFTNCRGSDTITVRNTGTTTVQVSNPNLIARRWK